MYNLRLCTFGFNQIESSLPNKKEHVGRYTIYGNGLSDQVIILFLRAVGFLIPKYKPLAVELESMKKTKLTMTRKNFNRCIVDLLKEKAASQKTSIDIGLLKVKLSAYFKNNRTFSLQSISDFFQSSFDLQTHETYIRILKNFSSVLEKMPNIEDNDEDIPFYIHTLSGNISFYPENNRNWTKGILFFREGKLNFKTLDNLTAAGAYYLQKMKQDFLEELKKNKNYSIASKNILEKNLFNGFHSTINHFSLKNNSPIPVSLDPLKSAHRISFPQQTYIGISEHEQKNASNIWQLAFDQDVNLLVKLTDRVNTSSESETYWPLLQETFIWENLSVKCVEESYLDYNLHKRIFEVKVGKETKKITQLDFTGWPDMCVPDMEQFMTLLNQVDEVQKDCKQKPIMVHCKAGIGRTGTFITSHQIKNNPKNSIPETIISIRRQRPYQMVETSDQYIFIHKLQDYYQKQIH